MSMYLIIGLTAGVSLGLLLAAAGAILYLKIGGRRLLDRAREEAAAERDVALKQAHAQAREIELAAKQAASDRREKLDEQLDTQSEKLDAAQEKLDAARLSFEDERARVRRELDDREAKLDRREDSLDRTADRLNHKEKGLADRERQAGEVDTELAEQRRELSTTLAEAKRQLRELSRMTEADARAAFLARVEDECKAEAGEIVRRTVEAAHDEAKERARTIIVEAIQRYAAEQTADHTVSSITIADEAMKGRVIGREGRNIRSFEKATGVDVIIDDTPGVVGLSCFDPVRREIARVSLERLIADGRIHPGRIEEVVNAAVAEMEEQLVETGKQAVHEAHVTNLPRPAVSLLGRLHYRTSYGQNVLRHCQEVAHLTQVMADELGLDGALARRAGLLHDIGKAMDHESEGGHPEIGAAFLRKIGEPEAVINAAAAHHGDVPATTPYTPLVMAADAISASRPGARRESLERYIKRLKELEGVATGFRGVRQAYAIHAGREIRVIADAKLVTDAEAASLARDIAKKIEGTLNFPGEVRITVLRESRAVEFAR